MHWLELHLPEILGIIIGVLAYIKAHLTSKSFNGQIKNFDLDEAIKIKAGIKELQLSDENLYDMLISHIRRENARGRGTKEETRDLKAIHRNFVENKRSRA